MSKDELEFEYIKDFYITIASNDRDNVKAQILDCAAKNIDSGYPDNQLEMLDKFIEKLRGIKYD